MAVYEKYFKVQSELSVQRISKICSQRQPLQNYFRISQNGVLFLHREKGVMVQGSHIILH